MRSAHLARGALALLQVTPALAQHIEHEHGPAGVHSHRGVGPHFIDAFYTENGYLERKVRPDVYASFADGEERYTAQLEIEWAVLSRASLILHAPFHHAVPSNLASQTGPGDVSVGGKVAVVNDRRAFILATGADLEIPTGDDARGLGEGHAAVAPFVLAWIPFGPERRWLFQAATHVAFPLERGRETPGEASGALSWTSPLGVTPIVEGLAEWSFDGGPASWWVAPEVRWEFVEAWELGAGARVRLSGPDQRKLELAVGMIHHFPLP